MEIISWAYKITHKIVRKNKVLMNFVLFVKRQYQNNKRKHIRSQIHDPNFWINQKLEICGGRTPYKPSEYINCDILKYPEVDVIIDITEKLPFPDDALAEVFSCATLEHISLEEGKQAMREFFRILKPGGKVIIAVPDLNKIIANHRKGEYKKAILFFAGAMKDEYDYHRYLYTADEMIGLLTEIGFSNCKEVDYNIPRHQKEYMFQVEATKQD